MSLAEKILQARAHVLDGGVIEWEETDTAGVPVVAQRRKTPGCDGQHQKRYLPPYHDNEWQDMDGGFLEFRDEDNDIQEEIRAVESVRVLPKPAKVKCNDRAAAVDHMIKGGVIEYRIDRCTCRRKMVDGVHYFSTGGAPFHATPGFLQDASWMKSAYLLSRVTQLYNTLYLLPIEE